MRNRGMTRRALLGGAAGMALAGCGVGCGVGKVSGGSGPPVEFADARGKRVRIEHTPKRVVAYVGTAAGLWDFGFHCVAIYGMSETSAGKPTALAGNLDLAKVPSLGQQFEQFDQERYARLNPELLICPTYDRKTLWGLPTSAVSKIEKLAPTLAVRVDQAELRTLLRETETLAARLGADVHAEPVVSAKRRFEQASQQLAAVTRQQKGLRVAAVSPWQNNFYVDNPLAVPELAHLRSLGLDVAVPRSVDAKTLFEAHSWEEPEIYDADVILYDTRETSLRPDQLRTYPTWQSLPPVRTGQLHPFVPETPFSYQLHADNLEALARALPGFQRLG